jgi:hypothetical protein
MIETISGWLERYPAEIAVLISGLLVVAALREILWIQFYSIKLRLHAQGNFPGATQGSENEQQLTSLVQRFAKIITWFSAVAVTVLLLAILKIIF